MLREPPEPRGSQRHGWDSVWVSCARPSAVSPTAQIPAACSPPLTGLQVLAFVPVPVESSNNASMPRWAVGGTRRLRLVLETPGLADVSPRVRTNCDGPSRLPGEEALLRRDPKTLVSRKARFLRPEGCTRPRDFDSAGPGWF